MAGWSALSWLQNEDTPSINKTIIFLCYSFEFIKAQISCSTLSILALYPLLGKCVYLLTLLSHYYTII